MTKRLLPLLGLVAVLVSACEASLASKGRHLFDGEVALTARIAGHTDVLPTQASRCINCHDVGTTVAAPAASTPQPGLAGRKVPLSAAALVGSRARRGGPPSRFDEPSFCRLLRTGIDPASVLIAHSMPRYELDAPQCQALWAYLSGGAG